MNETQWSEEPSSSTTERADDQAASETRWGEETEEAPRKKRGIPKWLLFGCGGGCLVAMVLVAVIAWFGVRMFQQAKDPEYVWGRIDRILPYAERPDGYRAYGQSMFGLQQWFLVDESTGTTMIVIVYPARSALDDSFDPESQANRGVFGVGAISDAELGTIELQGRETRCLRFFPWIPESGKPEGDEPVGASIRIDLTGDTDLYMSVQITLPTRDERVSDETVRDMLEPFDVWRADRFANPPGEPPTGGLVEDPGADAGGADDGSGD